MRSNGLVRGRFRGTIMNNKQGTMLELKKTHQLNVIYAGIKLIWLITCQITRE